jgi:hypothetical protein
MRKVVATCLALFVISFSISATPALAVTSAEATTLLTNCIAAINDPLYTRATLPGIMTYNGVTYANDVAIENALVAGTLTIWIATTSGSFGSASGNSSDLFCGNFQDNTPTDLDSSAGKRDYFFGGAGNDSVNNMWESVFYGGLGNDSVANMSESSYFYGGPGTDSATNVAPGSFFYQEDPDTTAPIFTSAGSFNVAENGTFVTNVVVNESSTITISAGDDQAKFTLFRLNETSSALSFITAPNFEAPTDNGANNTYALTVRAVDGATNSNTQNILVTVTDINENSSFVAFTISSSPTYATTIQISATINLSAKVSFKVNDKRIPGCISVATATNEPYVATCYWKPSRRGSLTLTATATPISVGYSASSATPLRIVVANRSTNR